MGLFRFFRAKQREASSNSRSSTTTLSSRVQDEVHRTLEQIPEISESGRAMVFEAALQSISKGRDLSSLSLALLESGCDSMTKSRAGEISRLIHNAATATLNAEKQLSLGIRTAVWLYSGAPCMSNPKDPSVKDIHQDQAHKAASGKTYEVSKGMLLAGVWTLPGHDEGCKCTSKSVIPGLD